MVLSLTRNRFILTFGLVHTLETKIEVAHKIQYRAKEMRGNAMI